MELSCPTSVSSAWRLSSRTTTQGLRSRLPGKPSASTRAGQGFVSVEGGWVVSGGAIEDYRAWDTASNDLIQLVVTGGGFVRTEAEFRALLEAAGSDSLPACRPRRPLT